MSKIRVFLTALSTVRYIDDAKFWSFVKYSAALPYKEGHVILNRSVAKEPRPLRARSHGSGCRMCVLARMALVSQNGVLWPDRLSNTFHVLHMENTYFDDSWSLTLLI